MFISQWKEKKHPTLKRVGRNSPPTSNLTTFGSNILKKQGFSKLYATKQTCFYLSKTKEKKKMSRAVHSQQPTVAPTPGHNDNVMTNPAAAPRILRENQKMKLKYSI